MHLLLLTAADFAGNRDDGRQPQRGSGTLSDPPPHTQLTPLPSLDVLPHEVSIASIASPLQAALAQEGATHPADAILLDGTRDPRAARAAALALSERTRLPRVAILRDAALAALSPEWGVADFLTPEASPAEIDARLKLLAAAHTAGAPTGAGAAVEVSGVEIDESNFIATVHGRTLDLTYKEFELLHFLALHPARVFTREQLLTEVWGTDYFGGARTVDVHVRRLRAKLGEHELLISTVRGVGYGFARGSQG
ncbi:response regulator transcription factor [Leucobacter komagatae]|uniref:response regulator transcription factor n=1 Tax=Leucobacter komagatae TaxID=55969 RepID=UPI0009FE84A7|nr:response regulator transcription factor [Leucobacter komagatae]